MELVRTWILGITVSAMVLAAADTLMPEGAVKKAGRFTGGLVLILCVLQPLVKLDYEDLYAMAESLPASAICTDQLEEEANEPMKAIIEEELATYIVDKAAQLGASCSAAVTCRTEEQSRVPVPNKAVITGSLTPAQKKELSDALERELGIAPERQIYKDEGVS